MISNLHLQLDKNEFSSVIHSQDQSHFREQFDVVGRR